VCGEFNAYKITAQAKDGETTVMTVRAGTLQENGTNDILLGWWEINPPETE